MPAELLSRWPSERPLLDGPLYQDSFSGLLFVPSELEANFPKSSGVVVALLCLFEE